MQQPPQQQQRPPASQGLSGLLSGATYMQRQPSGLAPGSGAGARPGMPAGGLSPLPHVSQAPTPQQGAAAQRLAPGSYTAYQQQQAAYQQQQAVQQRPAQHYPAQQNFSQAQQPSYGQQQQPGYGYPGQSSVRPPMQPVQQRPAAYYGAQAPASQGQLITGYAASGQAPPAPAPTPAPDPQDLVVLPKRSLKRLAMAASGNPGADVDAAAQRVLAEVAEGLVSGAVSFACSLARRRKSKSVAAADVAFYLERTWHLNIPGFVDEEIKPQKRRKPSALHAERLRRARVAASADASTLDGADGRSPRYNRLSMIASVDTISGQLRLPQQA